MSRYIDADKLSAVIENTYLDCDSPYSYHVINDEDILIGKFQTIDIIDDQPTADVQEVKHGKWIKDEYSDTVCSCCKQYVAENEDGYPIQELKDYTPSFCPNCGAKMDLGYRSQEEE